MALMSFGFVLAATVIAVGQARSLPREPSSIVIGRNGAPVLMMRLKRQPVPPYPHRSMMFTGYYPPTRSHVPLTGVFAQGNAVSGSSYLGGSNPNYPQSGPEPPNEADVTSSDAEATPESDGDSEQNYPDNGMDGDQGQAQPEQQDDIPQYGTEGPVPEEPVTAQNPPARRPSKPHKTTKQGKKTKVQHDDDVEDEDEEEDSEEEDAYNSRRKGQNFNNFFPMVFRFPSSYGHRDLQSEGGSPPGLITAIANSYSTGKGGVASSVATAYGGSPNRKVKRARNPGNDRKYSA